MLIRTVDLMTTATVDVVAYHAGYNSRSSFVPAFRKAYGRDPTDLRQSARDSNEDKAV